MRLGTIRPGAIGNTFDFARLGCVAKNCNRSAKIGVITRKALRIFEWKLSTTFVVRTPKLLEWSHTKRPATPQVSCQYRMNCRSAISSCGVTVGTVGGTSACETAWHCRSRRGSTCSLRKKTRAVLLASQKRARAGFPGSVMNCPFLILHDGRTYV